MVDKIELKPASQIGSGLEPGELALDEAARLLYLDHDGVAEAIPLDVVPVPPPGDDVEPTEVVVMGESGPTYATLSAGGGGRPLDAGYVVPGVVVTQFSPRTANLRLEAVFEVWETTEFDSLRVAPAAGVDILLTAGVTTLAGVVQASVTSSAYAGPFEAAVSFTLAPGRYKMFVQAESALQFSTLLGTRAWGVAPEAYPLALRAV